jgi:CHASE3 domain sensor protein
MPPTSLSFGCGVFYNMESIRDNFRSMSGSELHRLASLTDRVAAGADGAVGWLIGVAVLVILIIVILMHTDRRVVVR